MTNPSPRHPPLCPRGVGAVAGQTGSRSAFLPREERIRILTARLIALRSGHGSHTSAQRPRAIREIANALADVLAERDEK